MVWMQGADSLMAISDIANDIVICLFEMFTVLPWQGLKQQVPESACA